MLYAYISNTNSDGGEEVYEHRAGLACEPCFGIGCVDGCRRLPSFPLTCRVTASQPGPSRTKRGANVAGVDVGRDRAVGCVPCVRAWHVLVVQAR